MKSGVVFLFFVCFFASSDYIRAQQKDVELWSGGELNFPLPKKFSLQLTQIFKFNDTISRYKSSFAELGLRYKLNRIFDFKINYRFISDAPDENTNRFSFDVGANVKKKEVPVSFHYRLRYQHESLIRNENTTDNLRNKFTVRYNLSKMVDPFISFEMFYRLNKKNEFREFRYSFGMDWKLKKNMKISSGYFFSDEFNMKKTKDTHVFFVTFSYSWERKQSKDL